MPIVHYDHAAGTKSEIKAIEYFERFLDDNHEKLSNELHKKLLEIHAEIDDEVYEKLEEMQSEIDELKAKIEELEGEE